MKKKLFFIMMLSLSLTPLVAAENENSKILAVPQYNVSLGTTLVYEWNNSIHHPQQIVENVTLTGKYSGGVLFFDVRNSEGAIGLIYQKITENGLYSLGWHLRDVKGYSTFPLPWYVAYSYILFPKLVFNFYSVNWTEFGKEYEQEIPYVATSTVLGYELVTTKAGTFYCAKIKTEINSSNSYINGTRYLWINGSSGIVKMMYYHSDGSITRIELVKIAQQDLQLTLSSVDVWINKTNLFVNVSWVGNGTIIIEKGLNDTIYWKATLTKGGSQVFIVNLSQLGIQGKFFVHIVDENGLYYYENHLEYPPTPEAMLKFFRMYDAIVKEDSFRSGNATIEVWNSVGLFNVDDSTNLPLENFVIEASANIIQELWWSNYAVWNTTYVRWSVPKTLSENEGFFVGFRSGTTYGNVPISVWREVNKSVFNSVGYQLVNVTLRYDDVNFSWGALNVNLWRNDLVYTEIVPGSFTTDAPVTYYEEKPDHIHVEFSSMQPNRNYTFSVLVKVVPKTLFSVVFLPQIKAEYGHNMTTIDDGFGKIAEVPKDLLPPDVNFIKVSVNYNNSWKIQKGELSCAVLDGKIAVIGNAARLDYFESYTVASYDNEISSGVYNVELRNAFGIYNVPDDNKLPIDGFTLLVTTDKPIKYVWWNNKAKLLNYTAVIWDFRDYRIYDGKSLCCLTAVTDDGIKEIPVSVERSMNVTKLSSGYQLVNVTFRFNNLSADYCLVSIDVWNTDFINSTILVKSFKTNFPFDWSERFAHHLEIGAECSKIENKTYYLEVVIRYDSPWKILAKPRVHAALIKDIAFTYYGNSSKVHVNFTNISAELVTSGNLEWVVRHALVKNAVLEGVFDVAENVGVVVLTNSTVVSGKDSINRGNAKGATQYYFYIWNRKDLTGKIINGTLIAETNKNFTKVSRSLETEFSGFDSKTARIKFSLPENSGSSFRFRTDGSEEVYVPCSVQERIFGSPGFEGNYSMNITVYCDSNITKYNNGKLFIQLQPFPGHYVNSTEILGWESNIGSPSVWKHYYLEFPVNTSEIAGSTVYVNISYRVELDKTSVEEPYIYVPRIYFELSKPTSSFKVNASRLVFAAGEKDFKANVTFDNNVSWDVYSKYSLILELTKFYEAADKISPKISVVNVSVVGSMVNSEIYVNDTNVEGILLAIFKDQVMQSAYFKYVNTSGYYWINATAKKFFIGDGSRVEQVTAWVNANDQHTLIFGILFTKNGTFFATARFYPNGSLEGIYTNPKCTVEIPSSGKFYPFLYVGRGYSSLNSILMNSLNASKMHIVEKPVIGEYLVQFAARDTVWNKNESKLYAFSTTNYDVNGDGKVDINDVSIVAWMVLGKVKQDVKADFNGNGWVDIGDLVKIVYVLMGKL